MCLANVMPGTELPPFQLEGAKETLLNRKMLLGFDTGTGKTFTYSLIVRGLLNRNPEKKHVLVIIHDSIDQVPRDVSGLVNVAVETFDGTVESAGRLRYFWDRTSIFVLTLEALRVPEVVMHLFERLPEIESFVIDEAHHCSNWNVSDTAFMIRALTRYIPYVVELSATPMTRESKQFYRLMNLLDRRASPQRNETYMGKYVNRYLAVNRKDYDMKGDYLPNLIVVEPTLEQMQPQKGIVFRNIKGSGAEPQVQKLVEEVQKRLNEQRRVLVYLHYHDTRRWVEDNFTQAGIKYASLHGKLKGRQERQEVLDRYRSGEVDVLITSVTESLNIDADCVIFYEFTTLVKQVIGRAHRGLKGKRLEVAFVITKDTDEVEFFMKYIYQRSITIQNLLGKDYSELIEIGKAVEKMSLE